MLKVYLDRAARSDAHGVIAIAGAMFWPFFYDQFLHLWEPFLRDWNAKAFHATDFYPGAGEFWRKRPDGKADRERTALFERHRLQSAWARATPEDWRSLTSWLGHWNKYAAETRGADKPRPLRADIKALMEMLGVRGEKIDVRLFTGTRLRLFLLTNGCTVKETVTA
jgi:hypothetical protein